MQLINTSIFDQESQARTKAMEESRKLKAEKRAGREQAKVMRHAQFVGSSGVGRENVPPATSQQIVVHGIPFQVAKGGSKLIRLTSEICSDAKMEGRNDLRSIGDPSAANATPKKVSVGGVSFVRSKKGNLHRLGAVVSKKCVLLFSVQRARLMVDDRKPRIVKKKDLCKRFTAMGTGFSSSFFFPYAYTLFLFFPLQCRIRHDPLELVQCCGQ